MLRKLLALAGLLGLAVAARRSPRPRQAPLRHVGWSFDGPFGMYDQDQLQRGFKVYTEVCSQCHSLNLIAVPQSRRPRRPVL